MELRRLTGRKICANVQRKGKVWRGKHLSIRWLPGPPRHPNINPEDQAWYTGTVAPSKLHKSAVKRNRMRRRCREALRGELVDAKSLPTIQLLLTPRSSSLDADFAQIREDIRAFLSTMN